NNFGQLIKQVDPDGVTKLFQYNGKGEVEYTCTDLNQNGTIDFSGTDRITRTVTDVLTDFGTNVLRTRTYEWNQDSSTNSILTATSEASVDGLKSWTTAFGLTATNITVYAGSGNVYATNAAPDGTSSVTWKQNGRVKTVTRKDSTGTQVGQTSYGYD